MPFARSPGQARDRQSRGPSHGLVVNVKIVALRRRDGCLGWLERRAVTIAWMRSLAQDGRPFGVRANAVLPGWVRTETAERSARAEADRRGITAEQVWDERSAIYPPRRVLTPREVAQVIFFLCSDNASGINGEAITVALGGVL